VDRAHGQHGGIDGPRLAADDRLQGEHDARREHHGILGGVGIRAVAADAAHDDVDRIDIGHRPSFDRAEHARRQRGAVVQRQRAIGPAEPLVQARLEHLQRPHADLLGRLADEHHLAAPARSRGGQRARRADQAAHVHIVAAGVHRRNLVAACRAPARLRGPGHAGLLLHRQPVEVGAHEDRAPGAVLQHADDAVAASEALDDFAARLAQLARDRRRGASFLAREFRIRVEVLVQGVDALAVGRHRILDESTQLGGRCSDHRIDDVGPARDGTPLQRDATGAGGEEQAQCRCGDQSSVSHGAPRMVGWNEGHDPGPT
jgi:hypothetical protein